RQSGALANGEPALGLLDEQHELPLAPVRAEHLEPVALVAGVDTEPLADTAPLVALDVHLHDGLGALAPLPSEQDGTQLEREPGAGEVVAETVHPASDGRPGEVLTSACSRSVERLPEPRHPVVRNGSTRIAGDGEMIGPVDQDEPAPVRSGAVERLAL